MGRTRLCDFSTSSGQSHDDGSARGEQFQCFQPCSCKSCLVNYRNIPEEHGCGPLPISKTLSIFFGMTTAFCFGHSCYFLHWYFDSQLPLSTTAPKVVFGSESRADAVPTWTFWWCCFHSPWQKVPTRVYAKFHSFSNTFQLTTWSKSTSTCQN